MLVRAQIEIPALAEFTWIADPTRGIPEGLVIAGDAPWAASLYYDRRKLGELLPETEPFRQGKPWTLELTLDLAAIPDAPHSSGSKTVRNTIGR